MSIKQLAAPLIRIKPLYIVFAVSILLILGIWLPRLHDALFVDESGSYWIILNGASQVASRTFATQGESPFYFLVLQQWSTLFGTSEAGLRALSTLFALGTLALLYALGRSRDRRIFYLAIPILICTRLFVFSAVSARPYMMGVFFAVLSVVSFVRWMRNGSMPVLLITAASFSLALCCHPTMGSIAVVLLYLLWEHKPARKERRALCKAILFGLLCAVPFVYQIYRVASSPHDLAVIHTLPGAEIMARHFVSFPMFIAIVLGAIVIILRRTVLRDPSNWDVTALKDLGLAGTWYAAPKLCAFLAALVVSPAFFVPRYSLLASIGEALIIASLLMFIANRYWRLFLTAAVMLAMATRGAIMAFPDTGWRPALQYVEQHDPRHQCAVFAAIGLVEAQHFELVTNAQYASFIAAPLTYYHLDNTILLPFTVSTQAERAYLENSVFSAADAKSCAFLFRWELMADYDSMPNSGPSLLAAHLLERHFAEASKIETGYVTLVHWQRGNQ